MLVFVAIILVLILAAIALFAFPQISAVPYFPSNKKDLPLIIRGLNLRNNQTVIDLGAGNGMVVFAAAKKAYEQKLNTKFVAVELNPILLLIMYIKHALHQNKENIRIVYADMFKANFRNVISSKTRNPVKKTRSLTSVRDDNLTIYLYISPWFLEKIYKKLKKDLKKFELVSYYYPVPDLKPTKTRSGKNKVFTYL